VDKLPSVISGVSAFLSPLSKVREEVHQDIHTLVIECLPLLAPIPFFGSGLYVLCGKDDLRDAD